MSILRKVPPSPDVMRSLFEEYLQVGRPAGITFKQYLQVIGFTNPAEATHDMDNGTMHHGAATDGGPARIFLPGQPVQGQLRVMVLLVDFDDWEGTTSPENYESLLFSKGTHPTGSMRDYYDEVSLGKVDVTGEVHGWFRLPRRYSYYTNGKSGTGRTYPRNAQRMAEDAVHAALDNGVVFNEDLDVLGQDAVTALFVVHAGIGAESQPEGLLRTNNIWSHKWVMPNPVRVGDDLWVNRYLTVPNNARLGVAAHELGHLAFQWEDFYDPNYAEDGSAWDGAGDWDLMAGGSYNGNSRSPAHPVALHKSQHGWIELEEIRSSGHLVLDPFTATSGRAYKLVSPRYRDKQYLILENRTRFGFDSYLPGEGLLVWRVDERQKMFTPLKPALQLVQADGRHDLERIGDRNAGDSGDPFPGSTHRDTLSDTGSISTSFPGGDNSGIVLQNIQRDPVTGRITLDAQFGDVPVGGEPPTGPDVVSTESAPSLEIPDNHPAGVEDIIILEGDGMAGGITVAVDISHPYIGDLIVELISPSGRRAILHNRTGGNARDLMKAYTDDQTTSLQALTDTPVAGEWKLSVKDSARRDTGILNRWRLAIDVTPEPRAVHERRTPGLRIPDKDPGGISAAIHVTHGGIVRSVGIGVHITHPFIGDLRVELSGPAGARALLHNMTGGSTRNLETRWQSTDTAALAGFVGTPVRGTWVLHVSDHQGNDVGTLDEWTLDIDLSPGIDTVEKAEAPGLAIPDDDPGGASSHISIDKSGTVQSIGIEAAITHSYIGDLRIELISPSGEGAVLHDRSGGNKKNIQIRLDSAESPLLASLVGQPIEGNWILRVMDLEPMDKGTLDSWSLKLMYTG